MCRYLQLALALALMTLVVSTSVSAQGVTPSLLNYQGLLADANGEPINAQGLVVTFRIWDDPVSTDAADLKWEETVTINVTDGLFNVLLGESVPITEDVFATSISYLGLTIQGEPESSPRTRLVSSGYSNRVETVDGARGGVISGTVGVADNNNKDEELRIELLGPDGIPRFWASANEVLTPCVLFSADSSLQCTAAMNSGAAQAETGAGSVVVSSELTEILSQSINCPADGFVMAMGSFEAEGNVYSEYSITLTSGLSDSPTALSASQSKRWTVYDGWDKTYHLHRNVISHVKIFPVSAGENTFYILGERTEGNHDFNVSQSTLSLIFIPSAYGEIDGSEAQVSTSVAGGMDGMRSRQSAATAGGSSAVSTELARQAAEISDLKEQIGRLEALLQVNDSSSR